MLISVVWKHAIQYKDTEVYTIKKYTALIDTKFLCKEANYISHKYLKYLIFGLITADSLELLR